MNIKPKNLLFLLLLIMLTASCLAMFSGAQTSNPDSECQHSFSITKGDRDVHWDECENCSEKTRIKTHTFENGVCTICGEEEVLYGDANGDGKIDSKDIILLKKYIANLKDGKSSVTLGPKVMIIENIVANNEKNKKAYVELYEFEDGDRTVDEKDEIFYGDANGDGTINSKDIILLKKYIANLKDGKSSVILGHNVIVAHGYPATCTENGITDGITCTDCGKVLASKEVIPANGHKIITLPAVEPTCTETGLTRGEYCSVCETVLMEQSVIRSSGHVDVDFDYLCEKCGASTLSIGLSYYINSDYNSCTIRGIGTCTDRNVNIPEYIDGYKVTGIENTAFYACDVESVTIPKTVTRIGKWAFNFCKLKKVVILGNNTTIEYGAFMHCSELEEIVLTEGVSLIENYVFEYCTSLKSVKVPGSVKSIGYGAFMDCTALEKVVFEDGIDIIGEWAFQDCTSLVRVVLPESVTIIKEGAFNNCSSLTDITLPSAISSVANYTFQKCSSLEYINIPTGVTSIGEWAFWSCNNLKKVVIPDSVESIGELAFYQCPSIEMVFYGGNSDIWSKIIIDSYNSNLTSATRYYYSETKPSDKGDYWYYVDGIPAIWPMPTDFSYVINEDSKTCSITGYQGTKKSITIPESVDGYTVTAIGDKAFYKYKTLKSITIPDSVTSIGGGAFYKCTSLASITIPDSVTSIGYSAFYYCTNLKTVNYTGDIESWLKISFDSYYDFSYSNPCCNGASLYFGGELVTDVVVPNTITKINNYAFCGCTNLVSITIPDSVTSIGYSAFSGCTSLASITIPDSVTSIGNFAFADCTSLKTVNYTGDIESWLKISFKDYYSNPCCEGASLYFGGELVTDVVVPNTITKINDYAFYNCKSLESITIPDSVTSIGDEAFWNCTSLAKVYYGGTADQWSGMSIGSYNYDLTDATRYYYSETEPTESGNYWHYVDGVVTEW